jgi:hypothetical protein
MQNKFYLDNLCTDVVKHKMRVRESIVKGVSMELANALIKDAWFMSNELFGVGVFSNGVEDDGRIMESRCYTELEKHFRGHGLTTKQIVKEFSEPYLRQFFMSQWIESQGFRYI